MTFEDNDNSPQIEIIVGKNTGHHQTPNIIAPTKVYFRRADENTSGTIEIEEADGTKTLVYLTEPVNTSVKGKGVMRLKNKLKKAGKQKNTHFCPDYGNSANLPR